MRAVAAQECEIRAGLAVRVLPLLLVLALGCASTVGRRFSDVSLGGRERAEGSGLGEVGSVANLSQGYPWVPEAALCRKTVDGRDIGNVFLARIVTPVEAFGFRELLLKGPAGERSVPGRVRESFHVPGFYDPRYTEVLEVPLGEDDVRWMVEAGAALETRMEGDDAWILLPTGSGLARAVRDYAGTHGGSRP